MDLFMLQVQKVLLQIQLKSKRIERDTVQQV